MESFDLGVACRWNLDLRKGFTLEMRIEKAVHSTP